MSDSRVPDFSWLEIGRRIRDWRLWRGWSQQQLAEAAGMSQSGVVHLEKGDTNPQIGTLRDISSAFGKTLRELMLGSVPEVEEQSAGWLQRIRRVADSNDKDAVSAVEWGLSLAELLLERRSGRGAEQLEMQDRERESKAMAASVGHGPLWVSEENQKRR